MSDDLLDWQRLEDGKGEFVRLSDGYYAGYRKVDRHQDGYLASVEGPAWTYDSGLFATAGRAKAWVRHIIARDRRAPMGFKAAAVQ